MNLEFRTLKAEEIECRVGQINEDGFTLLIYKDARCDMDILDETVGKMNWKRAHSRDNANCTVSIWDSEKNEWVGKEDTGTESNTEKEKGLASDSFKRACVNWGIGRELYTAPKIKIKGNVTKTKAGKFIPSFWSIKVTEIEYNDNREISKLVIMGDKDVIYTLGGKTAPKITKTEVPLNPPTTPQKTATSALSCVYCGKEISQKIYDYSTSKFSKPLCMDCQKKEANNKPIPSTVNEDDDLPF